MILFTQYLPALSAAPDFFSHYLLGWNAAAVICLVAGLALMVAEMFTPGMGIAGVLGACALVASIVLSANSLASAAVTLALILVLLGAAAFFVFRSFKNGAISHSPIVLKETIHEKSTSLSDDSMQELIGLEGETLTALRPSGNAAFGEKRFDVVSAGEFIPKGSRVRIESVEGLRITVRQVEE